MNIYICATAFAQYEIAVEVFDHFQITDQLVVWIGRKDRDGEKSPNRRGRDDSGENEVEDDRRKLQSARRREQDSVSGELEARQRDDRCTALDRGQVE